MVARSDLQDRTRFLISKYGGVRPAAKATGIPKSTITKIARGEASSNKRTRDKVNRQFRKRAPQAVKDRESSGLGTGSSLVDEATARKLEKSYLRSGTPYKVAAHGSYSASVRGIGEPQSATEYGRGSSVDEAKGNLTNNLEGLARRYRVVVDVKKIEYRVYRVSPPLKVKGVHQ